MSEAVDIYTKPGCPYCKAAKEDMVENDIAFIEHDITSDQAVKDEAIRLAGKPAVPVIVKDGRVTIGFGGS